MTNKIKPVSQAAAQFFMNEIVHCEELEYIYRLLAAHGFKMHNSLKEDAPAFAAFCRAVAQQLDPLVWGEDQSRELERKFARKCFRLGYRERAKYSSRIDKEEAAMLSDESIDKLLKIKELLND